MRAGTAVALALFCLYAFICAAIDLGFGRALFGTFVIIVAFAVVFAYVSHLVQHWTAVGLFLVFVAVWFWIGSTRHPDIDAVLILVIMIATIIGWGKFLWGHADRWDSPGNSVIWLSAIAVAWIACSLTDRFLERTPQPRTSDRHAKNLDTTRWPGVRVGVTLSGGGYRATLMHAGTLDVSNACESCLPIWRRCRAARSRRATTRRVEVPRKCSTRSLSGACCSGVI